MASTSRRCAGRDALLLSGPGPKATREPPHPRPRAEVGRLGGIPRPPVDAFARSRRHEGQRSATTGIEEQVRNGLTLHPEISEISLIVVIAGIHESDLSVG